MGVNQGPLGGLAVQQGQGSLGGPMAGSMQQQGGQMGGLMGRQMGAMPQQQNTLGMLCKNPK